MRHGSEKTTTISPPSYMIWGTTCIRKKKMGLKKQQHLACLSLLLLIIIILKAPKLAVGYGRFNKFRNEVTHHQQQQGHDGVFTSPSSVKKGGNAQGNGDDIFDDGKRKVHTGPNPLHNR